ncbi:hypothetical protein LSM04_005559 [Trypanosoma melophagium]|uniref:uncharacterized protein n=1 Tax=Trypanosoma melophagium TaxID=715481 RepID=UPI00351A6761|nr:hypothetical protein LSM04_005559 [Trypanosoma melophagium]
MEARFLERLEACKGDGSSVSDDILQQVESLRAANEQLREELRIMEENHHEEMEGLAKEAAERIAEHDELLEQKLKEQEDAMEARFLERLEACKGDGSSVSDDILQQVESLRAANDQLREELRIMEENHHEEMEGLAKEAAERIAEHDELLEQKLKEQEDAMEARFLERLEACKGDGSSVSDDILQQVESLRAANDQLREELRIMEENHHEEMEGLAKEAAERIAEHDELLEQKLKEQEDFYEVLLKEKSQMVRVKEDSTVLDGVTYWKEEYEKLYERCEKLQSELMTVLRDTAEQRERLNELELKEQQGQQKRDQPMEEVGHENFSDERQHSNGVASNELRSLEGEVEKLHETLEFEKKERALREVQLHELQNKLESMEKEYRKLEELHQETVSLLHEGAASVESVLKEKQSRIEELEVNVQKLSQQFVSSQEQLRVSVETLQQRQKDLDEAQQRHLELEAAHREVNTELVELRWVLNDHQRVWKQRLERMQNEGEQQQRSAAEEIKHARTEYQRELDALRAEIDELREELKEAQTVAATLPLSDEGNRHQLEHLREQLNDALSESTRVNTELEKVHRQLEEKNRLLRSREQKQDSQHSSIDDKNEEIDTMTSDARINSLLQRNEVLDSKVRELMKDKETLLQEKDTLEFSLQSAARTAEVREQACIRQADEVKRVRAQINAMKDDITQRVQLCNTLRQELQEVQRQALDLAAAYEDLQATTFAGHRQTLQQQHVEALIIAKAMTVPRAMQDLIHGAMEAYQNLLLRFSETQKKLRSRCDVIEQTATEAMIEGERQSQEFLAAIEDAKIEQQQLREIIERLEDELNKAKTAAEEAEAEVVAMKEEKNKNANTTREEKFALQRELQAAKLEQASLMNQLELLRGEKINSARLLAQEKETAAQNTAEQQREIKRLQEVLREKAQLYREAQEATEQEAEAARKRAEQSLVEREEAMNQMRSLQFKLDRVLPRVEQLETERAELEAELIDTKQQLNALMQRSTSCDEVTRRHIENLNITINELRTKLVTLRGECDEQHAMVEQQKLELETSETEIKRLRTRLSQQEREAQLTQMRLVELESTYAHDTGDAAANLREAQRRVATLEQRNNSLQEELETSRKQCNTLQENYSKTEEQLRRLSEVYHNTDQQQKRRIQELTERTLTLEGELDKLQEAHTTLDTAYENLRSEFANAKKDGERALHCAEEANRHNRLLHKELQNLEQSHAAELQTVRETLSGVQKELTQSRRTLVEAEAREQEQSRVMFTLTSEKTRFEEELNLLRSQLQEEQQLASQERSEKQEKTTHMRAELLRLQNTMQMTQQERKTLEETCAQQAEKAILMQKEIENLLNRYNTAQQEAAQKQEQSTATVKTLQAECSDLQSRLNNAEDALEQQRLEYQQRGERMARKIEERRVAEEALRAENADLQQDLRRLEEKLKTATQTLKSVEATATRQDVELRAVTQELQEYKTRVAADEEEQNQLRKILQEKTLQLERLRRQSTADLDAALAEKREEEIASREALETIMRREQQATREARHARERALSLLAQEQQKTEELEVRNGELQQQLRQAQSQVAFTQAEVQNAVKQVAEEVGLPRRQLSLSGVMNELLLRLSRFTHSTIILEGELTQFEAFETACEAHTAALRNATDAVRPPPQLTLGSRSAGASVNTTSTTNNTTNTTTATTNTNTNTNMTHIGIPATPSSPVVVLNTSANSSIRTPHQQPQQQRPSLHCGPIMQEILSSATTYNHRLVEHRRTIRYVLDTMEGAIMHCDAKTPMESALAKNKLFLTAILSELHLRVARQTTLLQQIADGAIVANGLQEAVKMMREDEEFALRPFNELLLPLASFISSSPSSTSQRRMSDESAGEGEGDAASSVKPRTGTSESNSGDTVNSAAMRCEELKQEIDGLSRDVQNTRKRGGSAVVLSGNRRDSPKDVAVGAFLSARALPTPYSQRGGKDSGAINSTPGDDLRDTV